MISKNLFKALLLFAGLAFSYSVQAQGDLDIYNSTTCDYDVYMKQDDGSGTCNVNYFSVFVPAGSSFTFNTGVGSGIVFHVAVVEAGGTSPVSIGDCTFSSCSCALPNASTVNACGSTYNINIGGGNLSTNAVLKIY